MIAALDAQYDDDTAAVACVNFGDRRDAVPSTEATRIVQNVAPYVPVGFRRRELPCIRAALDELDRQPDVIVVDGYVDLDAEGKKGLGAHLHESYDGKAAVVGVAKTEFRDIDQCEQVLLGQSAKPLFVASEGISPRDAARAIESMHGDHRTPTLLKRVDRPCRETLEDWQRQNSATRAGDS